MTLDEYREQWSGAPDWLFEFAEGALQVTDAPDLVSAARGLLDATRSFEAALEYANVAIG